MEIRIVPKLTLSIEVDAATAIAIYRGLAYATQIGSFPPDDNIHKAHDAFYRLTQGLQDKQSLLASFGEYGDAPKRPAVQDDDETPSITPAPEEPAQADDADAEYEDSGEGEAWEDGGWGEGDLPPAPAGG